MHRLHWCLELDRDSRWRHCAHEPAPSLNRKRCAAPVREEDDAEDNDDEDDRKVFEGKWKPSTFPRLRSRPIRMRRLRNTCEIGIHESSRSPPPPRCSARRAARLPSRTPCVEPIFYLTLLAREVVRQYHISAVMGLQWRRRWQHRRQLQLSTSKSLAPAFARRRTDENSQGSVCSSTNYINHNVVVVVVVAVVSIVTETHMYDWRTKTRERNLATHIKSKDNPRRRM